MPLLLGPVLMMASVALFAVILAVAFMPSLPRPLAGAPALLGTGAGTVLTHAVLPDRSLLPCLVAATVFVLVCGAYALARPGLTAAGAALWVTWLGFGAAASAWGVLFLISLSLSQPTTVLVWVTVGLGAITVPSAIVTTREGWEPLLRRSWRRPRSGQLPQHGRLPRVSIHVPCHAEPPDIVNGTLDRLAALDYPDFEVLVIDNNTTDPDLWHPVRAHCAALGGRFRFIHVEGLSGAKAGALNLALRNADPVASLIAVVDADYRVEPEWLRRTVGYFEDPAMGFVQCPHAYRDYEHSRFGRWANWEYSVFFNAGMVSLDEHRAGLTVGTMSLISRQALVAVGGWAEWCMTEDSELAIRIHAAGWESQYLTQVYGRGLIPPTFAGYRKQRFRWTYGPVQELRQHWRLFLPCRLGGTPSCLSPGQKLHHANHGIDVASVAVRALAIPLGAVTGFSMLIHHERVPVPVELWCASTSALVGSLVLRYLVYTRVVGATLRQALGGTVAFAALSLVIATASLKSAMGRPVKWLRTDKFPSNRHGLGVLRSARNEAAAAVACVTAAGLLVTFAPVGGVVTMLAIALGMQAATYSAAVGVAAVADLTLPRPSLLFQQRRGRRSSSDRGALRRPYESNNPGPS